MNTILLISIISFASSYVNCSPIKMQEFRIKRAVFDILPSAENRATENSLGSTCQCAHGTFHCFRDEKLVCRRTLNSLEDDEYLQIVDRIEHKIRRKIGSV
eukprot:GFUD01074849.1.p1 GENE.GFUD01074849.1~~GFUD01074849.1.p1  ORF type:complete len:112 (-),score=12.81 GFUD01074849.1:126-428(-)